MSLGDFLYDDSDVDGVKNYLSIYESVKEATNNSKLVFLDNQELEDSIGYFIDEEEPQKALEITNYALSIFPENVEFGLLKAETFIDLNDLEKAMALLNAIENRVPYIAKIYLLKASVHEINNEDDKVIGEYHKALFNDVNEPELIYEELGFYFLSKENYIDAVKSFKKCIEIDKDNISVFDALTDVYIENLSTLEGLTFFEQFTNANPDCINAWFSVGRIFQAEERYLKAIKAYEKVLQIDEYNLISIENAIQCLKLTENYKRVIKICQYYNDFMYPYFAYEMAETCFDMGDTDESLKYYFQLYNENQKEIETVLGIARCYTFQGYYTKAFQFIDIGLKYNKDNTDLLVFKGLLLKETGDYTQAVEVLEKALCFEFEGENDEAFFELADIYCELNDYNAAIDSLLKGIDENANNAKLMFFLASCYYNSNNKEKAYSIFEDAYILDDSLYNIFFEKCFLAQNDIVFLDIIKKNGIL